MAQAVVGRQGWGIGLCSLASVGIGRGIGCGAHAQFKANILVVSDKLKEGDIGGDRHVWDSSSRNGVLEQVSESGIKGVASSLVGLVM